MYKYPYILFPITWDCNCDCPGCPVDVNRGGDIDIDGALSALENSPLLAPWVFLTGGEPLLVPRLPEIILRAKNRGYKVGVTTNGTILAIEQIRGVDRVAISLDGYQEEHDALRGPGTFTTAITFYFRALIEKSIRAAESIVYTGRRSPFEVGFSTTVYRGHEKQVEAMAYFIEKLKPDFWQIQSDVNDPSLSLKGLRI